MKILFITTTTRVERPILDPSVRYRCYNHAENLAAKGICADVIAINLLTNKHIDQYDAFVFHRPQYSETIVTALEIIDSQNKVRLADYDDLIFGEENAELSSIYKNEILPKDACHKIFKENASALNLFDVVQTSSTPLAEQVAKHNPTASVKVVPNGLSKRWLEIGDIFPSHRFRERIWISYLSGTKSHDHDFALVSEALSRFIKEEKRAMLMVAGPLDYETERFPPAQIVRVNYRDYWDLPALIKSTDINISALEPTLFNNCKSGLKFFESGAFGVPTVASPMTDLDRFSHSGLVYARNEMEWLQALKRLAMFSPEERTSLRQYCRVNAGSVVGTDILLNRITVLYNQRS
ncbi:glycosyltransferase family protein [Maridesulfovibrio bastinii]|uniref:glycosyltransferase family protein n=1 Tax=Maridesulfovibrio bastinii TaxID=47157 RepID=UPI0004288661|nr:glycosyltransferase [Maridesulfovibrio bastinii]